jgi:hypothetical protein
MSDKEELKRWREWAQLVFLGGGALSGDDYTLRHLVCERWDADIQEARTAVAASPVPAGESRKIPRYDLVTNYRCGDAIEELERNDTGGEWVRWEDVFLSSDR